MNGKEMELHHDFQHLRKWCGEHLWAPSCFHGSVGNGWEVVSKYIETQDTYHAKNANKPCILQVRGIGD
ncbi:MAG: hypothetical protein Q8O41_10525 [Candidatus Methanoperedens sp.]|nr:hypothetical protein [Candidatus Methanoperedens sp.]